MLVGRQGDRNKWERCDASQGVRIPGCGGPMTLRNFKKGRKEKAGRGLGRQGAGVLPRVMQRSGLVAVGGGPGNARFCQTPREHTAPDEAVTNVGRSLKDLGQC